MLLVTAGMQSWHRATLGLLPTSLQPQEHLDISVGAVVSPRCFYRMRRGLLQEAGLCSLCWSWEDPEGSRRRDDPSCASDPDGDIFKQGIKIDSGWQRALDPGITVKGLGGGQGGPQPLTPSSPPLTPHPDPPPWLVHPGLLSGWLLCHHLPLGTVTLPRPPP